MIYWPSVGNNVSEIALLRKIENKSYISFCKSLNFWWIGDIMCTENELSVIG